jgi:histidinol-phosphate phosphatase family protein
MPGAREVLDRLRAERMRIAVVSNQSGVARGILTFKELSAVNQRIEELLGPVGPWIMCTHGPRDGCECRKPRPGLIIGAARALGVEPNRCALVGDTRADVEAAQAAGARVVLVPTPHTEPEALQNAPEVATDLRTAVAILLDAAN